MYIIITTIIIISMAPQLFTRGGPVTTSPNSHHRDYILFKPLAMMVANALFPSSTKRTQDRLIS